MRVSSHSRPPTLIAMGQTVDDRLRTTTGGRRSAFQQRRPTSEDPRTRYALDLVRDSVVILDRQGRITYINPAAEELFGCALLEIEGRPAKTTLFSESSLAFDTVWREVLTNGKWRGEGVLGMSETEHLVESRWSVVREQNSTRITSVVIVTTETSNTKLTAASLAHEIRNPLAGIKGVADAFLQGHQLTRQEREWMRSVRYEVMKIDARLRELLYASQSRSSNISLCLLNELISRVVVLATHQSRSITNRQIELQFIDMTSEALVTPLDSARIEDAVLNLILNGIESIEGDGRVTVCLRRSDSGDEAVIEVTDTGSGIPLEVRPRIFEPFFTTKREGTGLGLAAVRRTAAAYHGRLSFKTRLGRGSTFVLTLPIRSQPDLAENPE